MTDLRCGCISLCGAFIFAVFAAALCQAGQQAGPESSSRSTTSREGEDKFPSPSPSRLSTFQASSNKEDIQSKPRKPRCIYDNGAIRILLEELIMEFFKDLDDMNIELSSNEKHIITRRLRGFYNKATKHPAVHEPKIAFSTTKPTFHHEDEESLPRVSPHSLEPLSNEIMSKRTGQRQETCESYNYWDIPEHGKLQNETIVELFPKSWLFIRRCVSKESPCNIGNTNLASTEDQHIAPFQYGGGHWWGRGTGHRPYKGSSFVSTTSCLELTSWVPAFVRQKGYTKYIWDWIQVPSCCSCAIIMPDSR